MYRDHTCGELRLANAGQKVTLAGWVQRSRKLGGMTFIDLRDRYGITQLVVEADADPALVDTATSLGREYVIQVVGEVVERQSKNPKMPTGDIEIKIDTINILNKSVTPPFTIEDESDGGEDIRAKGSPTRCGTIWIPRILWRLRLLTLSSQPLRVPVTSWSLPE